MKDLIDHIPIYFLEYLKLFFHYTKKYSFAYFENHKIKFYYILTCGLPKSYGLIDLQKIFWCLLDLLVMFIQTFAGYLLAVSTKPFKLADPLVNCFLLSYSNLFPPLSLI